MKYRNMPLTIYREIDPLNIICKYDPPTDKGINHRFCSLRFKRLDPAQPYTDDDLVESNGKKTRAEQRETLEQYEAQSRREIEIRKQREAETGTAGENQTEVKNIIISDDTHIELIKKGRHDPYYMMKVKHRYAYIGTEAPPKIVLMQYTNTDITKIEQEARKYIEQTADDENTADELIQQVTNACLILANNEQPSGMNVYTITDLVQVIAGEQNETDKPKYRIIYHMRNNTEQQYSNNTIVLTKECHSFAEARQDIDTYLPFIMLMAEGGKYTSTNDIYTALANLQKEGTA